MKSKKAKREKKALTAPEKRADFAVVEKIEDYPVSVYHAGIESLFSPYASPAPRPVFLRTQDDRYSPIPPLAQTRLGKAFQSPLPTDSHFRGDGGADFVIPDISTLKTNRFNSPLAPRGRTRADGCEHQIPLLTDVGISGREYSSAPPFSSLKTNAFNSLPRSSRGGIQSGYDASIPPFSTPRTGEFNSPTPPSGVRYRYRYEQDSPIPPLSAVRSQNEYDSPIPPLSSVRADEQPEDYVSMRFSGGQKGFVRLPQKERRYYGSYVVDGDAVIGKKPEETAVKPVPKIFTLIKHKPVVYNEPIIIFALVALAVGKTLMLKADFGVTAVQSVPLLLSLYFDGISIGTWNLIVQGVYVLAAMLLSQKIKLRYLFAIGITLIYVFLLDTFVGWSANIVLDEMNGRIVCFAAGFFLSALSVTFFFKGNMPLMPFETLEKEIAAKRKTSVVWVKIVLDLVFFAVATGLSYILFGEIRKEALGIGTLIVMLTMSFAAAGINFVLNIFFTFRNLFAKTEKRYEDIGGFAIYSDV